MSSPCIESLEDFHLLPETLTSFAISQARNDSSCLPIPDTLEAPTLLYGILYLSPFVFDVQDKSELSVAQFVYQGKLFLKPPRAIDVRDLLLLHKCMARPTWQVKSLKTLPRVCTTMSRGILKTAGCR